jgi:ATP-dependent DNA ligase
MIPRLVTKPPSGDEWLHEIKYDGYRMQIVKKYVRLLFRLSLSTSTTSRRRIE